jgi:hypothetical protein
MRTFPLTLTVGKGFIPSPDLTKVIPAGETFFFQIRMVTRGEYRRWVSSLDDPYDLEERILQEAVVERPERYHDQPWDWENVPAGLPPRVVQEILFLSGFEEEKHPGIMAEVEAYLASEEAGYDLMIMTAFKYKLEELSELPADEWYRLIGLATRELAILQLNPEVFLDPEKAAKEAQAQQRPSIPDTSHVKGFPRADRVEQQFSFTSD